MLQNQCADVARDLYRGEQVAKERTDQSDEILADWVARFSNDFWPVLRLHSLAETQSKVCCLISATLCASPEPSLFVKAGHQQLKWFVTFAISILFLIS